MEAGAEAAAMMKMQDLARTLQGPPFGQPFGLRPLDLLFVLCMLLVVRYSLSL